MSLRLFAVATTAGLVAALGWALAFWIDQGTGDLVLPALSGLFALILVGLFVVDTDLDAAGSLGLLLLTAAIALGVAGVVLLVFFNVECQQFDNCLVR
jgi:hypothetical protein